MGFANFALISFHLKANHVLTDAQIPLFYVLAMGVDAVAGIVDLTPLKKRGAGYGVFNAAYGLAIFIMRKEDLK